MTVEIEYISHVRLPREARILVAARVVDRLGGFTLAFLPLLLVTAYDAPLPAMGLVSTSTTPMLLKLVAQHKLEAEKFATHHFSFDQFLEAYEGVRYDCGSKEGFYRATMEIGRKYHGLG